MQLIVLIGTSHNFQRDSVIFQYFVEGICSQHRLTAIGEEMSEDSLNGVSQSICHRLAVSLGIAHKYCDLDNKKRIELHILQENDIRANAHFQGWNQTKIEAEIRSSHAKRERYWLDRLIELDAWPALFVCGADHVGYFRDLAIQHGFDVTVAAWDWEPPAD